MDQSECIMVLDFKQNLTLDRGERELGYSFYNKPQRTLFTAALIRKLNSGYHVDYFDIFSDLLNHDSQFVISALELIFKSDQFQQYNIRNVNFWMDNAPAHFRTKSIIGYLCNLKSNQRFEKITLNYFTEYHGKCICDSHFALISRYYEDCSKRTNIMISTTDQLMDLLKSAFHNNRRNEQYKVHFMKLEFQHIIKEIYNVKLENFKLYYTFIFKDSHIIGKFSANDSNEFTWIPTFEKESREIRQKQGFQSNVINFNNDNTFKNIEKLNRRNIRRSEIQNPRIDKLKSNFPANTESSQSSQYWIESGQSQDLWDQFLSSNSNKISSSQLSAINKLKRN